MRVREFMTANPVTCAMAHSALTAAQYMKKYNVGALPVTADAFTRRVAGIVTDRDLCRVVVASGRDPSHVWVHECMTADPVCSRPDDDVAMLLALMKLNRVRRIPIVERENELVGIVALADLVRHPDLDQGQVLEVVRAISESIATRVVAA